MYLPVVLLTNDTFLQDKDIPKDKDKDKDIMKTRNQANEEKWSTRRATRQVVASALDYARHCSQKLWDGFCLSKRHSRYPLGNVNTL